MFDVTHLIQTGGLLLIALIIFLESGLMVGFFLPGDTLLFSAGILAAGGKLPLAGALFAIAGAAILGDNVGYHLGRRLGRRLFTKPDGVVFRKEYIDRAEVFYEKYGSKTMLVAHFVPIVRAFVPVTAGAAKMNYGQFALFDAIGDIAWALSLTLLGFFLGSRIPGVEKYIDPVLVIVIIVFMTPTLWHLSRDQKIRAAVKARFKHSKRSNTVTVQTPTDRA
jgi:membrane-associated protein